MWFLLLACAGPADITDTEDSDAGWEEIHSMGMEFSWNFEGDEPAALYFLGEAYAAQSAWIHLGDTHPFDGRTSTPYRTTRADDADWDDYWAWFSEPDREPFALRVTSVSGDSEYSVYEDADLGLDVDILDGWQIMALDLYQGITSEWADGTRVTSLIIRWQAVPE